MTALESLEKRCQQAEAEGRRTVAVATLHLRIALNRLAETDDGDGGD